MFPGGSAFLLGVIEDRAGRCALMIFDDRARRVPFKLIGCTLLCFACRWSEGKRRHGINRREAISHGSGRDRRFRELGTWIEDLFTTALLGDGRSRTNRAWDRLKFRRLMDAQLENRTENREKISVPGPAPRHLLHRQLPLLSKDYLNQYLPVLQEEVARDRPDLSRGYHPRDVQPIASSGELQVRLNHEESAYRS